jgi:hypothetical protein
MRVAAIMGRLHFEKRRTAATEGARVWAWFKHGPEQRVLGGVA